MSPFRFKPSTSGESLLIFLYDNVLSIDGVKMPSGHSWSNAIGGRGQAMQDFAISASALNLVARLIKKAERILEIEDSSLHHGKYITFLQQTLGMASHANDVLDSIARQSIHAAKMSKQSISKSTRRRVRQDRTEVECYLCGNMCTHKALDSTAAIYYEHLWPRSYGGDSVEENLLPACYACNNEKDDMILWHTGAVFSFVLKPNPSELERTRIRRREKVARRIQDILTFANETQCSLKTAAREIGPARFENLVAVDDEDAIDYFNLQFV